MVISYQLNNQQHVLFAKGNHAWRFALAALFSLCVMVIDSRSHAFSFVRSAASFLVAPIEYTVDYPIRIMHSIHGMFGSKKKLVDENMQLRYQQTLLEARLQTFMQLRNENAQLRELLAASSAAQTKTMAAQILAVETTRSRQLLILNKGSKAGVFIGQPVLDAQGVMGQIIDVGLLTSTVLLISDAKCAVPVRNNRTGENAILVGTNHLNNLALINLPKTSEIQPGDILITSGLGRRYPEGYPVGKVEAVTNIPGEDFIKVDVSPIALLNRSRLVLLIWPEEEHALLSAQIDERMNALEGQA